ncbi:ADP-glucose pyrophosphorylase [Mesorhizobium jarvisii]
MADLKRTQPLARDAMAYVLAGGRGSRLKELTDRRAKPAVYFGGKTRIIDFALSNALNSGIRRLGVATQYKAHSLIRHLQRGWNFLRPERNESFDILPASQRVSARSGMKARPTPSTRTSTSSRPMARNIWSFWPATTSTRWTTR